VAAFTYSAINASGLELSGELHAPDLAGAREQLRIRGLLANSLDELPASGEEGAKNVFK
jgi:type II secretory pathway component PulF